MTDRLDAASTELVLRRAFELARFEPNDDLVIGRHTLAEIAAEVDLPLPAVAAALAEHQLRIDVPSALIDRLIGPAVVSTQRPSTTDEDETRSRAVDWFQSAHGLRPRTQADGVVVAIRRRDVVGKLARTVRDAQGLGQLGKLRRIEFVAVDIGDEPGAVCVAADVGDRRRQAILGGAGVGIGSAGVVAVGAVVFSPILLVGLPLAAGAGVLTSRVVHTTTIASVREDLDEALDGITSGHKPPSILGRAGERLSRKLKKRS